LGAAGVDYVVVRRREKFTNYYQGSLEYGIPDARAELLHLDMEGAEEKFERIVGITGEIKLWWPANRFRDRKEPQRGLNLDAST